MEVNNICKSIISIYTTDNNLWPGKDIIDIIVSYINCTTLYKCIKREWNNDISSYGYIFTTHPPKNIIIPKTNYEITGYINKNLDIMQYLLNPPDNYISIRSVYSGANNQCYSCIGNWHNDTYNVGFYFGQDTDPNCIILKIITRDSYSNNIYLRVY